MKTIVATAFAKQVGNQWGVSSPLVKTEFYDTLPDNCPKTGMTVLVNEECFDILQSIEAESKQVAAQIVEEFLTIKAKYNQLFQDEKSDKSALAIRRGMVLADYAMGMVSSEELTTWTKNDRTLWGIAAYELLNEKMGGPGAVLEACTE